MHQGIYSLSGRTSKRKSRGREIRNKTILIAPKFDKFHNDTIIIAPNLTAWIFHEDWR